MHYGNLFGTQWYHKEYHVKTCKNKYGIAIELMGLPWYKHGNTMAAFVRAIRKCISLKS